MLLLVTFPNVRALFFVPVPHLVPGALLILPQPCLLALFFVCLSTCQTTDPRKPGFPILCLWACVSPIPSTPHAPVPTHAPCASAAMSARLLDHPGEIPGGSTAFCPQPSSLQVSGSALSHPRKWLFLNCTTLEFWSLIVFFDGKIKITCQIFKIICTDSV